jgi:3-methylcrotonyl-CoA carboxylase alpha subunit/acetyl-CoA/propionyl-CoA carboxylase biotin carboxyl carrier protein
VEVELERDGERHVLRVDRAAGVVTDGERRRSVRPVATAASAAGSGAAAPGPAATALRLEIDGALHEFFVERAAHGITVGHHGRAHVFRRPVQFLHDATAAAADGAVAAPMPGTVLAVEGEVGRAVRAGETLVVLEAMKMEIALQAPFDGTLAELDAAEGDQVPLGRPLFRVVVAGDAQE